MREMKVVCNRCGHVISIREDSISFWSEGANEIDLCGNCYQALLRWIKDFEPVKNLDLLDTRPPDLT